MVIMNIKGIGGSDIMSSTDKSFYVDLVHRVRRLQSETGWYEFKMNNEKPDLIGQYISALSNSAVLEGKEKGYLIWGIHNDTYEIEGTKFRPRKSKIGNEELENWLITQTKPRLNIRFCEFEIDGRNIVVLEVPCAIDRPTSFKDIEYIRVGSYIKNLKDFTEKERILWRHFDKSPFENMLAMENLSGAQVTEFLNCPEYFNLMKLPLPSNRKIIIEKMIDESFVTEMDNGNYAITNMGALLFAKDLNSFKHLKRKALRVILYKGSGRTNAIREEIFTQGYAIAYESVCRYIISMIPQNEEITGIYREKHIMFPEKAIREMVGNIMIHQDARIRGAGPMIEIFDTRIESSSPGSFLVDVDRIIDAAPHTRNEAIAAFLRIIHICEERGSGFDRMEEGMCDLKIPAPKVEIGTDFARTKLYWYPSLSEWKKDDKIRTCYLATCYYYVNEVEVSNAVLRERFGVEDKNKSIVSRIIKDTVKAEMIKLVNENASDKMRRYIPYWA